MPEFDIGVEVKIIMFTLKQQNRMKKETKKEYNKRHADDLQKSENERQSPKTNRWEEDTMILVSRDTRSKLKLVAVLKGKSGKDYIKEMVDEDYKKMKLNK
jgi:hypothetical protein